MPRGRLVVEGPGWAYGVLSLGLKLASPGSDKSHLLGASPLFFDPFTDGRTGGSSWWR